MLGVKFIKAQPTTYLMAFKQGKAVREGAGLSLLYYAPTTNLVAVPIGSREAQTNLVFGEANRQSPLLIRSLMPENGVIFSDGIESDFLEFTSGLTATISVADRIGQLVH